MVFKKNKNKMCKLILSGQYWPFFDLLLEEEDSSLRSESVRVLSIVAAGSW